MVRGIVAAGGTGADIVNTVDLVKDRGVKAIFVESSVSKATIERIAKEKEAAVVRMPSDAIAMARPTPVVISALPMSPPKAAGFANSPMMAILSKAPIIPRTVPNSPSSGATVATTASAAPPPTDAASAPSDVVTTSISTPAASIEIDGDPLGLHGTEVGGVVVEGAAMEEGALECWPGFVALEQG